MITMMLVFISVFSVILFFLLTVVSRSQLKGNWYQKLHIATFKSRVKEVERDAGHFEMSDQLATEITNELEQSFHDEFDDRNGSDENVKDKIPFRIAVIFILPVVCFVMALSTGIYFKLTTVHQQAYLLEHERRNLSDYEAFINEDPSGYSNERYLKKIMGLQQFLHKTFPSNIQSLSTYLEKTNTSDFYYQAWTLVASVHFNFEHLDESLKAIKKIRTIEPNHVQSLWLFAQITIKQNNDKATPSSSEALLKLYELSPGFSQSLALLGMSEFKALNYPKAINAWSALVNEMNIHSTLSNDPEEKKIYDQTISVISNYIRQAKSLQSGAEVENTLPHNRETLAKELDVNDKKLKNLGEPLLNVNVSIDSNLKKRFSYAFVVVQLNEQGGMPVVVKRVPLSELDGLELTSQDALQPQFLKDDSILYLKVLLTNQSHINASDKITSEVKKFTCCSFKSFEFKF